MIRTLSVRRHQWLGLTVLAVAILGIALAPIFASSYYISVLGEALAFAVFALALDLLWGVSGVLSFGHAAFFGIGAYSFGLLTQHLGSGSAPYVALIAALVVPAVLGIALGFFTFFSGVTGPYFAIITLTVALILSQIYYVGLAVAVIALVVGFVLVRGPFGQALLAAADSDPRAASLGYNTALLKTAVLAFSGAMAGIAGALYAPMASFVNPEVVGLTLSTNVIIWVALGGRGVLVGGMLGALTIAFLSSYLSGTLGHVWVLTLGILLLLVVLFKPSGLLGTRAIRRLVGSA
ncbi:MAG: branched-chain amino acid ABC transporter permease [Chloroflexi bacterium]|nr:MAG: branched-chain amino acid ABC transporter permease [Chloroflexota bacterium]